MSASTTSLPTRAPIELPLRVSCPLERVHGETQQFAERHFLFVGKLVNFVDGFCRCLRVELHIPTSPVNTRLATLRLRRFRRLTAREIILLGDARDGLFLNWLCSFRFRREDRRVLVNIRKGIDAFAHAAPAAA